ncbi:MAG: two-component system, NtrC family, nitrogen regulation sensor histidine kinase NtrY [Acidobacteriota bacterium]|jgi:nitrogen fixation/metabolism regulation signal transduction histidine kinase|nr:two-component system, NtrC family, nitrogen regulation sensor histidine kinase NtrY [Acidobacteriota bacterium]
MGEDGGDLKEENTSKSRRRGAPWLFGGLVLVLLTVLVSLQLFGLWEVFTPDTAHDTLLLYALSTLNFVAFFLFSFIFIRSLLKLRRERRERLLGSKIKTRLVVYFIAVSLLPITAMALFSYMFFNRSMEKWFSFFPQDVVRQARLAQDEDARQQVENLTEIASSAAAVMGEATPAEGQAAFPAFLREGKLTLVGIVSDGGEVLARGFSEQSSGREAELEEVLRRASLSGGGFTVATPEGPLDVVAVPLQGGQRLVAARVRRGDASLGRLIASAQTFEDFRSNQRRVRVLGVTTLGLLTLMLLFAATWSAIHLARGIGTPIRALAEAAKEVAGGNLSYRVDAIADDELAVLASAFNEMTAQLAENRGRLEANASELREKNLALEERRHYIETVLQTVSTGVISLDEENRVTTCNAAALGMLRLEQAPAPSTSLSEVVSAADLDVLERVLWRARARGRATEQMELARGPAQEANGNPQVGVIPVALTATALAPRGEAGSRGVVLVIEDLSELLAAQRAAAWSEVARRLAHEIKNPLTPIQLSAERIARNFRRLGGAEAKGSVSAETPRENGNGHAASEEQQRVARVVEECTATISREVDGLKAMVDEFTRFARLPHARLEPADLNEVVRQAVSLYRERLEGVRMDVLLAPSLPGALLDSEQIRRVFVNLIDNSFESLAEGEGERRITVATGHDPARGLLIAEVADTGHGIARTDFARLFQPYFSTRGRGTGLGLAIVQRIMTEHGGRIRAEPNRPRGARMIIELPVAE